MSFKEKKIVVFKAKLNFNFFLCFRSFSNFIIDIPLSFYNESSFSIAQFFYNARPFDPSWKFNLRKVLFLCTSLHRRRKREQHKRVCFNELESFELLWDGKKSMKRSKGRRLKLDKQEPEKDEGLKEERHLEWRTILKLMKNVTS